MVDTILFFIDTSQFIRFLFHGSRRRVAVDQSGLHIAVTCLVSNFMYFIFTAVQSIAAEIMAQHLRRDNIRILIKYLIDP